MTVESFIGFKLKKEAELVFSVIDKIKDRFISIGDEIGVKSITAFELRYIALVDKLIQNDWDMKKISDEQQTELFSMLSDIVKYNAEVYGNNKR